MIPVNRRMFRIRYVLGWICVLIGSLAALVVILSGQLDNTDFFDPFAR